MERIISNLSVNDLKDCTMSRIRENELDKLKIRLSEQSGHSIYGRGSSQYWTLAYQNSYDYEERSDNSWPTLPVLRAAVKKRLAEEISLITEREESLLKRMMFFGGMSPLFSDEEVPAADSLVRRLWCTCVLRDNGQVFIRVPDVLVKPIIAAISDEKFQETRAKMYALSATLHSMVYLHGMLYAEPAISHLSEHLLTKKTDVSNRLLYRYLKAEFDYCMDGQSNLVLIHPGLIHPERMLESISNAQYQSKDYTREMIIGGMSELLKEEAAAEDILRTELGFSLQPGYNPGIMVNDIKFLIKQGATHEQLSEFVSEKLATKMTPRIENALLRAETDTVRWQGTANRRLN